VFAVGGGHIDQEKIIHEISSALQNNFKSEIDKLKHQMELQQ
jgi:hypothetical protein